MKQRVARKWIEEQWQSYRRDVMPKQVPRVQEIETRRAFYAGAQALMGIVLSNLDESEEPTDEDMNLMTDVVEELKQFGQAVGGGKA